MVSQGAQTNGMNGKKLTKSYSEIGSGVDAGCQYEDERGWVRGALIVEIVQMFCRNECFDG